VSVFQEIVAQAVKEVAEEEGIPEDMIWKILPKVKEKVRARALLQRESV